MTTVTATEFAAGDNSDLTASKPDESRIKQTNAFDRKNIRQKLLIIMSVMMVLVVINATTGLASLKTLEYRLTDINQLDQAESQIRDIELALLGAQLHMDRYGSTGKDTELAMAKTNVNKAKAALAAIDEIDGFSETSTQLGLGDLQHAIASFDVRLNSITPQAGTRLGDQDREAKQLFAASQAIKSAISSDKSEVRADLAWRIYWAVAFTLFLLFASLLNSVFAIKRVGQDITSRAQELTRAMLRLVDGDKNLVVPFTDRVDEFGDMARSLEVFRRGYLKLDRVRAEQAEHAAAELERQAQEQRDKEALRAEREALLQELANKFERTVADVVGGVAAASTQLQLTASSMAASAEQSAMQATEVTSALSEASGGVTAAAAASDEFAMSIGEISRQAATSAELARKATLSAADADSTISTLSQSAQQVGQIVELISTIAQRTNLLALNASIEAARGGEAGRGFAVVASEVKELAAQTSKATDEVAQQIRAIQDSTGASVQALRAIGQQVEQLEATSVSIAAAVDQQSVAGQDLARSIDLAARSTDDVTSNIVNVREASLATGAAASQVLTSSTELEQQAVTLKSQVGEFLSHVRAA